MDSAKAEQNYEALKKYGHDLVADAEESKLDPVIGRDEEIRRVIQVGRVGGWVGGWVIFLSVFFAYL